MKKRLLALLLCVLMLFSTLAGCNSAATNTGNDTDKEQNTDTDTKVEEEIDEEFRSWVDSYEAFINDYVEFMKQYNESDGSDLSLIGQYATMMQDYSTFIAEAEEVNKDDVAAADYSYYVDASERVAEKLKEIDMELEVEVEEDDNTSNEGGNADANSGSSGSDNSGSGNSGSSSDSDSSEKGEESYTIAITSIAGRALSGVKVSVYKDGKAYKVDGKKVEGTTANGLVKFTLEKGATYTVKLDNLPGGYVVEDEYELTSTSMSIVADIQLQTSVPKSVKVGDAMFDFTITTISGEEVTLSELLKEKELVVLNFWYKDCTYCNMEVPYLTEAYNTYNGKMEILALNTFDSPADIAASEHFMGVPFKVAKCQSSWASVLGVQVYPYSILIDRYGVICEVIPGAYLSTQEFLDIFSPYIGPNYKQVIHP